MSDKYRLLLDCKQDKPVQSFVDMQLNLTNNVKVHCITN